MRRGEWQWGRGGRGHVGGEGVQTAVWAAQSVGEGEAIERLRVKSECLFVRRACTP
jgi:hypothetical protein